MSEIALNVNEVLARVAAASKRAGKMPEDITLVAATKTVDPERINEAIAAGIKDIGENRVQEFTDKYDDITAGVTRHFIGHLQTNKVKYLIGKTHLIHSADSGKLLDEIQRLSLKQGIKTNVLIEVNASGEQTKFGVALGEVESLLEENEKRDSVLIRGLMTIGPNYSEEKEIREVFQKTYKKFLDIKQKKYDNSSMEFLSMGMSADFEIAIEEGANIVRVGSAIFGKRNY
ncbi:MAG: YggS family pyridoxal phosphate-dependent enzyme [Clostridia bacterium]|nr:YggS family pyridoxal phosphate-dependent enzyme [Clostridia bacterium]